MTRLGADVAVLFGLAGSVAVGGAAYRLGKHERVRRRAVALSRTAWLGPAAAVPAIAVGVGVADFFLASVSVPGLGLLFPTLWPVAGLCLLGYAQVEVYAAAEAIRHHPDATPFDDDRDGDPAYRRSAYYRAWWTLVDRHHPHAVTAALAAFPCLSMAAAVLMLDPRAGVRLAGGAAFALSLYDLVLLGVVAGATYRATDDETRALADRLAERRTDDRREAEEGW